jgi:(R,R)-butanediol dehydrogenase / meso-butanediol dehydrogenase / diacetyl reductase
MKSARYYGVRDIRVEEVASRRVKKGEVKVEIEWCGICGSDMHEYVAGPMVVTNPPVTLGHEFSGVVAEVGEDVSHVKLGDRVAIEPLLPCKQCNSCKQGLYQICETFRIIGGHADGGFAEYTIVNSECVHKVPDNVQLDTAALIEPIAVVNHAVRQSQFKSGDAVAVFGAGPIGLLLTSMLRASGASQIFVVEISEARRNQAEKFGATRTIDPAKEDAVEIIKANTNGGVNVAFEVAGVQATFDGALASVKARGQVQIVALWEKPITYLPTTQLFQEKRTNTTMCYSPEVFPQVIQMLSNNMLNLDGVITKKIHLDEIKDEGFETFLKDNTQYKILVTPKRENLN